MIISARVVQKPRRVRQCAKCNQDILGRQLKLYGAAHYGEKPYNLYLHLECATDPDEKVQAALQASLTPRTDTTPG